MKKKQAYAQQEGKIINTVATPQSKLGLYKIALQASLISAGVLMIFILVIHYFTQSDALNNGRVIIESIIPISAMFIACWWYRENNKNEAFHFWQAILINGLIAFLVAVLNSLFIYVFCSFIAPEALAEHIVEIQKYTDRIKDITVELKGIEAHNALKIANEKTSAAVMATNEFQWKFIIGNIFMIISGLVMRRKAPKSNTK